jgi:hypothetical protein
MADMTSKLSINQPIHYAHLDCSLSIVLCRLMVLVGAAADGGGYRCAGRLVPYQGPD